GDDPLHLGAGVGDAGPAVPDELGGSPHLPGQVVDVDPIVVEALEDGVQLGGGRRVAEGGELVPVPGRAVPRLAVGGRGLGRVVCGHRASASVPVTTEWISPSATLVTSAVPGPTSPARAGTPSAVRVMDQPRARRRAGSAARACASFPSSWRSARARALVARRATSVAARSAWAVRAPRAWWAARRARSARCTRWPWARSRAWSPDRAVRVAWPRRWAASRSSRWRDAAAMAPARWR